MLFNSYIFCLLFLPAILLLWWLPRLRTRYRLIILTLASYLFYGWWDPRFVTLLMFSTVVDYLVGQQLHRSESSAKRKFWLACSVAINLAVLAYFKYRLFFLGSLNGWIYGGGPIELTDFILPVGISFYTFQTMSYSIDIFRRKAEPAESIWHFGAYVSLFPQLIAGPIVRYSELDQQLRKIPTKVDWKQFSLGIYFFVFGMGQKVLLADLIAERSDPMLHDYQTLEFFGSWFAMLGYTCQLYFDFAGYSNMAVGLGLLLGFSFPQNFNSPYKSKNISEFWNRWHITLSSWLRDYLFIPLGGSRHGTLLTVRNLFLVMALGGLWHGAAWTFVIWGLYHGILLGAHRLLGKQTWLKIPTIGKVAITFVAIVFGWVIFRSASLEMCQSLGWSMLGGNGFEPNILGACGGIMSCALLSFLLALVFFAPNLWEIKFRPNVVSALAMACLLVICVLRFANESPFLYFQF